jgi:hypothetical protein
VDPAAAPLPSYISRASLSINISTADASAAAAGLILRFDETLTTYIATHTHTHTLAYHIGRLISGLRLTHQSFSFQFLNHVQPANEFHSIISRTNKSKLEKRNGKKK